MYGVPLPPLMMDRDRVLRVRPNPQLGADNPIVDNTAQGQVPYQERVQPGNRGRGNQHNGSRGNRGRGNQAGNRGGGYQHGNRGGGEQHGNRGRGYQPGNRGGGNQAGNRGGGYQHGNRGRGNQAGNRGRGYQPGNRGGGYQPRYWGLEDQQEIQERGNQYGGGERGNRGGRGRIRRSFTESGIPDAVAHNKEPFDSQGNPNGQKKPPRKHILGFKRLESYTDKDEDDLVLELIKVKPSLVDLVGKELKPDWVKLLVKLFANATECSMRSNVIDLLSMLPDSRFMESLKTQIQELPFLAETTPMEHIKDFITDIVTVFEECLQLFPSQHSQVPVDSMLMAMMRESLTGVGENLKERIKQLANNRDALLREDVGKKKAAPRRAKIYPDGPPPEDFRSLSVVPTAEDLTPNTRPYLRPIKADGKYEDVEEYLDIQFRLLKEDFVQPLREGIQEIVSHINRKERRQNLKIYEGVQILFPICSKAGIIHRIRFDVTRMKSVQWKHSRRLLFGSLLCFSSDDYQTFVFATVANREPENLVKGEIEVRFHGGLGAVGQTAPTTVFSMVESPAYYQAYCHVLEAMQKIDSDNLPFKEYIVEGDSSERHPEYLRNNFYACFYNLSGCFTNRDKECTIQLSALSRYTGKVNPNESQRQAIEKALTSEFVVIQGPPGTGKTYVGLRIAHALLQNSTFWDDEDGSHMLIVCYTNHALDQFLEGLLKMGHTSLVRVGGRCESETLKQYGLREIKFAAQRNRETSDELRAMLDAKRTAHRERNHMNEKLAGAASQIQKVQKSFLDGKIYGDVVTLLPPRLKNWFKQMQEICAQKNINFMEVWLGVYPLTMEMIPNIQVENLRIRQTRAARNQRDMNANMEFPDAMVEDEGMDIEGEAEELVDRWVTDDSIFDHVGGSGIEEESEDEDDSQPEMIVDRDGFQTAIPSKRVRKQRARQWLEQSNPMTEDEVNNVNDPLELEMPQRWNFYAYLILKMCAKAKDVLVQLGEQYEECCERIQELDEKEDEIYLKKHKIIAMTTTGAARLQKSLSRMEPAIVIIEEAAEVLEAHVITSLTTNTEHVVLIGDHKQLKPKPTVYQLATKYNLELSLFERMLNNGMACYSLNIQHRMRPEIAELLTGIYPDLSNHPSVESYPDVLGVEKNLFFINHSFKEGSNEELKSKWNQHEAEYTAALCWYFLLQGYEPNQITVLTMYTGQLLKLKEVMPKAKFNGVRITAVDNYQGEENDIILLSLVRSNDDGKIGFTGIENRICVALSRAKKGLFVIGNISFLAEHSNYWAGIMRTAEQGKHIGQSLKLICRNHPNAFIYAKLASDFQGAPEGGCKLPCGYRLKCGHACGKACHPVDQQHLKAICNKPCHKECERGHMCKKKCHEGKNCGPCMVKVDKTIPVCEHNQNVFCHLDPAQFHCMFPVEKELRCGHRTKVGCSLKESAIQCTELVEVKLRCDHMQSIQCFRSHDVDGIKCRTQCKELLECGHPCAGTCSRCHQGRLHVKCNKNCERTLVCSHICKEPCSRECPPCDEDCVNFCLHSQCPRKCGEICAPCMEKCKWRCKHAKCTKLCHQPCDREPCNEPCPKTLRCGHKCIGLCKEKCPTLCRVCDKDKVEEVFFGTEDEEDARFIQLLDCPHFFEVSGLDQWMNQADDTSGANGASVALKVCPRCKTPIRKSWRYGDIIKRAMHDVNQVKEAVLKQRTDLAAQQKTEMIRLLHETRKLSIIPNRYGWQEETLNFISDIQAKYSALYGDEYQNKWENINENQVKFVEMIINVLKKMTEFRRSSFYSFDEILPHLSAIRKVCLSNNISVQQMKDVHLELQRLTLLVEVMATRISSRGDSLTNLETIRSELISGKKVAENRLQKLEDELNSIRKRMGLGAITAEEKNMIIKAVGLSSGHWYKCKNGHVYAIGECGGAMQESKCPECNERIGGRNHALATGNQHAAEFDGSRHAAWSDAANMNNFDLRDLR